MQRDDESLCAAAHRSRNVKMRRGDRSTGKNERGERREIVRHRVDRVLELFDARGVDAGKSRCAGRGEMRADLEQIDLRVMQLLVSRRERPRRARESDERAELVDGTV